MDAGRDQSPGQVLRTGGTDAGESPAARTPPDRASSARTPSARAGPRRLFVAVIVLALLAIALPGLLLREPDPASLTRDYLDALVDGDLATVRKHLDPVDGALDIALTSRIRAATGDRLTGYTIDTVDVRGDRAEVMASLYSPTARHTARLTLSARPDGLLRTPHWQLDPVALPVLQINPLTSTRILVVNGEVLEVPPLRRTGGDGEQGELLLHVLPGRYTFELPAAGGPLVPRSEQVLVPPVIGPWRTGTVVLDYGLTRFSDSQARDTILLALADCARSTSPQPPDCPFSVDLPAGTKGTWRLVTSPRLIYVSMRGSSFEYRGTGLVAEFTETRALAPAGFPADASPGTAADLGSRASADGRPGAGADGRPGAGADGRPGAGAGDRTGAEAGPRTHLTTVDFGTSLRRGATGFRLEVWGYTSQRAWPA